MYYSGGSGFKNLEMHEDVNLRISKNGPSKYLWIVLANWYKAKAWWHCKIGMHQKTQIGWVTKRKYNLEEGFFLAKVWWHCKGGRHQRGLKFGWVMNRKYDIEEGFLVPKVLMALQGDMHHCGLDLSESWKESVI